MTPRSWKAGFPKPKPAPVKTYEEGWDDALRLVIDITKDAARASRHQLPAFVSRKDVVEGLSALGKELAKGLKHDR